MDNNWKTAFTCKVRLEFKAGSLTPLNIRALNAMEIKPQFTDGDERRIGWGEMKRFVLLARPIETKGKGDAGGFCRGIERGTSTDGDDVNPLCAGFGNDGVRVVFGVKVTVGVDEEAHG